MLPPLGHRQRGASERDASGETGQGRAQRPVGGRSRTEKEKKSKTWVSDVRQNRVRTRVAWARYRGPDGVEGANRQGVDKRVENPDEVRVGKKKKWSDMYSVVDGSNGWGQGSWPRMVHVCLCANGRGAGVPAARRLREAWASPISPTCETGVQVIPCRQAVLYSCQIQEGVGWRKMTRKRRMVSHTGEWEQSGRSAYPVVDTTPRRLSRPWRRCSYGRLLSGPLFAVQGRPARRPQPQRRQWPSRAVRACLLA